MFCVTLAQLVFERSSPYSFCAASDCHCRPKAFEVRIWIRFVDQLFPRLAVFAMFCVRCQSSSGSSHSARYLQLHHRSQSWSLGAGAVTRASRLWHWSVNIRGHSGDTRWASNDKYWSWIIKINPDWVHHCPVSDIYRKIKMTPRSVFCVSIIYQDQDKLSENKKYPDISFVSTLSSLCQPQPGLSAPPRIWPKLATSHCWPAE